MTTRQPSSVFALHVVDGAMAWHIEADTVSALDGHLEQLRVARTIAAAELELLPDDAPAGRRALCERRARLVADVTDRVLDARPLLEVVEVWRDTPWWAIDPDTAGPHVRVGQAAV